MCSSEIVLIIPSSCILLCPYKAQYKFHTNLSLHDFHVLIKGWLLCQESSTKEAKRKILNFLFIFSTSRFFTSKLARWTRFSLKNVIFESLPVFKEGFELNVLMLYEQVYVITFLNHQCSDRLCRLNNAQVRSLIAWSDMTKHLV